MADGIYDRDYGTDEERKKHRLEQLHSIAKNEGFKIEKEYLDYNKYEKGAMRKQLLKDIEDGKVKNVIVYSLDRLSRDMLEATEVINKVEKNSGKCLFVGNSLQEMYSQEKMMMNFFLAYYKKEVAIRNRFKTKEQIFNEEIFDTNLKDKPIKLGYLIGYEQRGSILTENGDTLGFSFDDFSLEQLKVKVVPKEIEKDDNDYLNIVVKFAKEIDKDLFKDRLLQEEFVEDDEMEM